MRLFAATVGLVLLTSTVFAQPSDQLIGVKVTSERVFGSMKAVEGTVEGPIASSQNHPQKCTVWVNGFATTPDPTGHWAVMVPNEPVRVVQAWQPGYNVLAVATGRDVARVQKFERMGATEIRDLLNGPKPGAAVQQGGGDGGIRDLLKTPKAGADVQQGGGDGGIRDLLNKPKGSAVQQGGGDGGIRDLLKTGGAPQASPGVQQGGGDGGIRDLLKNPPSK
jgi:hypothetical protein